MTKSQNLSVLLLLVMAFMVGVNTYTTQVNKHHIKIISDVRGVNGVQINRQQIQRNIQSIQNTLKIVMELVKKKEGIYVRNKNLECMTKNLWFEAKNQDIQSQMAIAQVVRERVKNRFYPNSICEVVYETKWVPRLNKRIAQFSWYSDGLSDTPRIKNSIDERAYQTVQRVSDAFVDADYNFDPDLIGATMYHADNIKPKWDFSKLEFIKKVGSHKFYRELRS